MDKYIAYIIISLAMIIIDTLWLTLNKSTYFASIKSIQGKEAQIKIHYAIVAYLIMVISIIFIAIPFTSQSVNAKDSSMTKLYKSILYGGSIGFVIYGIYNFTSLAIYDNYELKIGLMDTAWGTFLYSLLTFMYLSLIDL
jgi:uncharacterized membrane protein